ncbi:MAG: DUF3552 domain-containing protein, partial [Deltaproteobacteria bacterium]|nr:DUF3552 domain-containing protein [Deltaproteobacteria bacterium]
MSLGSILLIGLGLLLVVAAFIFWFLKNQKRADVRDDGSQTGRLRALIEEAEVKAKGIEKEAEAAARELILKGRLDIEENHKIRMQELQLQEKDLRNLELRLERRQSDLDKIDQENRRMEQGLSVRRNELDQKEKEYGTLVLQARRALEKASGISSEEAKRLLMDEFLSEIRHDASKKARQIEEEVKESAEQRAKKI